MTRIGYGEHEWSNIDTLVYDASRYRNAVSEATQLRHLLGAIASIGAVRIPAKAIEAHLDYTIEFDPRANEYILRGPR